MLFITHLDFFKSENQIVRNGWYFNLFFIEIRLFDVILLCQQFPDIVHQYHIECPWKTGNSWRKCLISKNVWANFVFFYTFTDFLQNLGARVPQVLLLTWKFRIGISFEQGQDEEIFWHCKLFVMLKSILHKYWSTINKNYFDMFVQKKWNKQTKT